MATSFIHALTAIGSPFTLAMIVLGTVLGVAIGSVPGLNGPVGVALLLPFTYGMNPAAGLLMLGGIYMGSSYGCSITAILLNTPGQEAAVLTAMEGFPLAQSGRAKEALYYAIWSAVLGGLTGVIALILFTPFLAKIALKFGPPEMFLIAMLGLAIVGGFVGNNVFKGLISAAFGILLGAIGPDPVSGMPRLTFGINQLDAGIPLIPAMIGLFAISEMVIQAGKQLGSISSVPPMHIRASSVLLNIVKKPGIIVRSSLLGTLIGVLPGTGGAVASFISYGIAQRTTKRDEPFGTGNPDGIIAAESGNNAAVGGAMVPLLALGVPGSATAAILYGALTIHGMIPGPELFIHHPEVVYTFSFGMLVTIIVMLLIGVYGVPYFTWILKVKLVYIVPIILATALLGAYSIRNNLFDVLLAIIFGVVGILFKKSGIPIAPIVLGMILGPIAETNFRHSLTIAHAQQVSLIRFFAVRPISIVIFVLLVALIYLSVKGMRPSKR